MKFKIFAGMSGSFNDIRSIGVFDFEDEGEAVEFAFETACDIYDSYAGSHGLADFSEIFEELGNLEKACDIFEELREEWLYYDAVKVEL